VSWHRQLCPLHGVKGFDTMFNDHSREYMLYRVTGAPKKAMLETCPRGNNNFVNIIFLVHGICLYFMLESIIY
jgi:hypothetical protein